ncbi:MAG: hypothetical protein J5764_06870 [Bacteroidales bacterium]|nr:hypothetical protein [Bacteroidales bacterium]
MKKILLGLAMLGAFAACSSYDDSGIGGREDHGYSYESDAVGGGGAPGGSNGQGGSIAGIVTAGEWNDLDHWDFWSSLMTAEADEQTVSYKQMSPYWGFYTKNRIAVKVTSSEGAPQPGVQVTISNADGKVWSAVTDVEGRADCWAGLHKEDFDPSGLEISLDGVPAGQPALTTFESEAVALNEYSVAAKTVSAKADILFIVDATGSMSDEILFLKDDLTDILGKVEKMDLSMALRTGALFYRDEGDEYVTRVSPFSDKFSTTVNFIKKQYAAGGGDFPEAVHTALEASLQNYVWDSQARTRLAFILLDAPPHHDHQGVLESVWKSIDTYAELGIKLIPVASSGIDKETEFLLRMMAMATGGTYVFLTNDSGVGNDHIAATVGAYTVEPLNDLMVRLICKYLGN